MFLVISRTHGLLPFAYRLKLLGEDVEALVSVPAFEVAWNGKLQKVLKTSRGELRPGFLEPTIARAEAGELTVLTDDWSIQTVFGNAKRLFGVVKPDADNPLPDSRIRFGGWFTGEKLQALHLLAVDRGAWPGGLGPAVDASLTMVRVDNPEIGAFVAEAAQPILQQLKSLSFRGLVQVGVDFSTGTPQPDRVQAGWPFLHTHAFLSELEDFSGLLLGNSNPILPKKFVSVVAVSQPPWPNHRSKLRKKKSQIENLSEKQMARVFWHDVVIDEANAKLSTGGLDGLVGISRGAAETSELARGLALEIPARLAIEEKQFRPDACMMVQSALAELEQLFQLTI